MNDLLDYIRTVPDYPIAGVNFYDMNSLFAGPQFKRVVTEMSNRIQSERNVTHIVGVESRGFVLGAAIAHELSLPFVMVRKKGAKYPGKLLKESYELEYGKNTLVLQEGLLGHVDRCVLVDDLCATGGSLSAAAELIKRTGARCLSAHVAVDLKYLRMGDTTDLRVVGLHDVWDAE